MAKLRRFALVEGFTWDERTQRYRDARGRFVAQREIKRAVNTVLERAADEIRDLSAQMASGEITIDVWQQQMAGHLKNLHLAGTAAGRGGFAQLDSRDYGRIGARLRFQYDRLQRFARDLQAGRIQGNAVLARAEMYALSGNVSFEEARRDGAELAGMVEERRILGPAEHCEDCVAAAAMGWQPIGTLPPIGDSRCLTNCKCSFEYRRKPGTEEEQQ